MFPCDAAHAGSFFQLDLSLKSLFLSLNPSLKLIYCPLDNLCNNCIILFSAKLDGVKTYMRLRRVPNSLQNKVIKWFDYLWLTQKSSDEEKAVSCLPGNLILKILFFMSGNRGQNGNDQKSAFHVIVSPLASSLRVALQ